MAKCILITCTDSMMKQFLEPHVVNLVEQGYEVELACSEVLNRFDEVVNDLGHLVKIHRVCLRRSPLSPNNIKGYFEMREIIEQGDYDLIWTNEPVMGVITRLAAKKARKRGTKVLYMVHGFHFYKGAPLLNWLLWYPIECFMAPKADVICTINREDYARAQKMHIKQVEYIHGVGINTDRLHSGEEQTDIREELGIPADSFLVLSVGELNKNKNQQVIVRAIAELNDPEIHYILCGKGDQREPLEELAKDLGVSGQVHFLGYRKDVVDICSQSDVFAMPSKREGLPIASLEAMYCGLPLVNSNIRGLSDITENGVSGYVCEPNNVEGFSAGIQRIKADKDMKKQMGEHCKKKVRDFELARTSVELLHLMEIT